MGIVKVIKLTCAAGCLRDHAEQGATGIVEMLFCTSLVALVGAADQPKESPRRLHIVNTKVGSSVTISFEVSYLTHARVLTAGIHHLRASFPDIHSGR